MGGVPDPLNVNSSGSFGQIGPVAVNPLRIESVRIEPGNIGPVTVAGIPDTFHIHVEKIPKILIGADPITLRVDPVEFNMRIKELPDTRVHLPANFNVGLSLLGMELLSVRLCGEAQLITEPYVPNPCEHCGKRSTHGVIDLEPSSSVPKLSVTESSGEA